MKEIKLTRNKIAFVDDEDYEYLNQWKWNAHTIGKNKPYYAIRSCYERGKKTLRMHRVLIEKYIGEFNYEVDHIDGNGLNNQKENLRIVTRSQNCMNRKGWGKNGKGIKKIIYKRKNGTLYVKYQCRIHVNKKYIYLGTYKTIEEAKEVYLKNSKIYHKEFGKFK